MSLREPPIVEEPKRARNEHRDGVIYDFIIVGSGAGGGPMACNLARRGFSVLLIEAGPNLYPMVSEVPAFHAYASEEAQISRNYFVEHYAKAPGLDSKWDGTKQGLFYPRSSAVGGCTIHNAMITMSGPEADWNRISWLTNDRSWSGDTMRRYFERLENCEYARYPNLWERIENYIRKLFFQRPKMNRGRHGFTGWLWTGQANPRLALRDRTLFREVLAVLRAAWKANLPGGWSLIVSMLIGRGLPFLDANHWRRLQKHPEGLVLIPISVRNGKRSSCRDYILETLTECSAMTLLSGSVVSRVLFKETRERAPRAIGVAFLESPAGNREREVFCRCEVVLCGGAFSSPQLLMLSGIGPRLHLEEHKIRVLVDLPGVGKNLQDRYEMSVVSTVEKPFKAIQGMTRAALNGDANPPLKEWASSKSGFYATNGTFLGLLKKSRPDLIAPDLCIFGLPGNFRGYYSGYSRDLESEIPCVSWVILKTYTSNRSGTVCLRSSSPMDTPKINFHYFAESIDGGTDDLAAIMYGIEFVREIGRRRRGGSESFPGERLTKEALRTCIEQEAWGHHASCSCPIGANGDPMAVLDSEFRVRGTRSLRVVDASAFPTIPGFFLATNVYMISEKAADLIIDEYSHVLSSH